MVFIAREKNNQKKQSCKEKVCQCLSLCLQVINIGITDALTKYVCLECEQKICTFDEFCLMVANVQRQLAAPSLEIDFAEVRTRPPGVRNYLCRSSEIYVGLVYDKVYDMLFRICCAT